MEMGMYASWASPNIVQLTSDNSPIPMSESEASWIVSLMSIGGLVGVVVSTISIEFFGSKKTVLATSINTSISWLFVIIANSVGWLYVARFIGGLTSGSMFCCFSMYLAEVSLPSIRGTMVSIAVCGLSVGVAIGTILETYLHMRVSSSIYFAVSLIGILLLLWLPDSPYYLVKTNNIEDAKNSILKYYSDCSVEVKLKEIKDFVNSNACENIKDKLNKFKSPAMRKSMFIVLILFVLSHTCGTLVILSFMQTILIKAKCYLIEPQEIVIYANILSGISSMLISGMIDKFGRRFILIITSIGTTAATAALGTHFYLLQLNFDAQSLQFIPIVPVILYSITSVFGYVPVATAILSEIFPQNIKSVASFLSNIVMSIVAFIVTASYVPLVELVGEAYVFWTYAVFCFLATPFALFVMPETKGKSFQEIQNFLNKN